MKQTKLFLRTLAFAALIGGASLSAVSCNNNDDNKSLSYGSVSGVVVDEEGQPLADAEIIVSGMSSVATAADGSYNVDGVSQERHFVLAAKTGYQSASKTVRAASFTDGRATIDLTLVRAASKIRGRVLDELDNNKPLKGVKVETGKSTPSAITAEDGTFEISGLALLDYNVTFTYSTHPVLKVAVAKAEFVNDIVDMGDICVGGGDILKTKDRYELAKAAKLIYDDYRSGNGGGSGTSGAGAFWDWSTSFMAAVVDRYGNIELQNEGFALRPSEGGGNFTGEWDGKNERTDVSLPENKDQFHTYFYGAKKINATNSKLTVRVRCHQAPSTFGVQVVDLSTQHPQAVKIATFTHPNGDYANYNFDLTPYVGKEIVVVVGQYRDHANGIGNEYWHQLPVARITFSSDYIATSQTWWPGDEVVDGWKLTKQMVANTGVQTLSSFTGLSPEGAGNDKGGIGRWYGTNHIGAWWHLIAVSKDIEPVNGSGMVIKTTGNGPVSTTVPESFLYAKFAIAAGANRLTVKARTFSDTDSFFKLAAFDQSGSLLGYVTPTATAGEAAADNTWKFHRNSADYAQFDFDLSAWNGQNVTVAFGVFKGESNGEENKIAINSIALN
jgi:hypothetical protein